MTNDDRLILEECNTEIEKIKEWIDNNSVHLNVKFLVSYAVIKACGSIEIVCKSMINRFLSQNCIDETKMYLEKNIVDSSANPSPGRIERFLEQFDTNRKNRFTAELNSSIDKTNLKSLVSLRNDIAHGRAFRATINDVQNYYNSGKKVLSILESILLN